MNVDRMGRLNYYEILEVSQNASQEVLKAAYKSLMQRYHPDRNPGNKEAAERSVLVVQAYEVLSDSAKRAAYDIERKLQFESLSDARAKARNNFASASLDDTKSKAYWLWWLLFVLVVLTIWFVWSPFGKQPSLGSAQNGAGSLIGSIQPEVQQNQARARVISMDTRTIPSFIKDLNVNLAAPAESADASSVDPKYVLSIQTIDVVVGTFDPDKFISFLENNKGYIANKLSEKLVNAKYDMLIKHNGDQYLKQVILDSLNEITGADHFEKYSSPGTEPPAQYGVENILLPDSFTVKAQ